MRNIIRLGQVEPVLKRVADSTTTLLGDTIALSDEHWAAPSRLPGWTRADVAWHLTRGAASLTTVARDAINGRPRPVFRASTVKPFDSCTSGMEIQVALDTTAAELADTFDEITDWLTPVFIPLGEMNIGALVVARLHEVCLHHVDLKTSFQAGDIDPVSLTWLLQWASLWRNTMRRQPAVRLESDSGVVEEVGTVGERRVVYGSDAALWLWITGRSAGETLDGADGIYWQLLG